MLNFKCFLQALATDVVNLPAVIDLIQRLREKNVDVDAVFEFFNRLFGWTATPPPPGMAGINFDKQFISNLFYFLC